MLLAGDIGGTNTRLGVFAAASPRPAPVEVRTYATGDFPTLESMLATFLADAGESPASIEGAAFGVAGPVVQGRAALTNAAWQIDARAVAGSLGLPSVRLLNDLLAMAHAIPVLAAGELRTLQSGAATLTATCRSSPRAPDWVKRCSSTTAARSCPHRPKAATRTSPRGRRGKRACWPI